jgi:hypothetical protein
MIKVNFNVMVYSVPKSGTHLVSDILALMYQPKCNIYSKTDMYNVIHHQKNDKLLDKIVTKGISTHPNYISYKVVKTLDIKKIFIIRHPLDIAISRYYYNEERRNTDKRRSMIKFVSEMLPKIINQVKSHIDECNQNKKSLLLTFENITTKKKKTVQQIADFMNFKLDPKHIENIVTKTNFEKVHNQEKINGKYIVGKTQPNMFHRNGKTKQWEKEFTPEQYNQFLKLIPDSLTQFN